MCGKALMLISSVDFVFQILRVLLQELDAVKLNKTYLVNICFT